MPDPKGKFPLSPETYDRMVAAGEVELAGFFRSKPHLTFNSCLNNNQNPAQAAKTWLNKPDPKNAAFLQEYAAFLKKRREAKPPEGPSVEEITAKHRELVAAQADATAFVSEAEALFEEEVEEWPHQRILADALYQLLGEPPHLATESATWPDIIKPLLTDFDEPQILYTMDWALRNGPADRVAFWKQRTHNARNMVKHFPRWVEQKRAFETSPKVTTPSAWSEGRPASLYDGKNTTHKKSAV